MRDRITFRPERPEDEPFLYRLYVSTREPEMRYVDWSDEQKTMFLRQQFHAQTTHYKTQYADADYSIILVDGAPAGRLYLHQRAGDLRIMDILLAPEHRGSGIGTLLLREILDRAAAQGHSVSIHVEQDNPALRLYERLGFRQIDTFGVYLLMEWKPDRVNAAS
ncbi:MAG TPA: GNAT family N-acetyltransferase [Thermoanaerobaculia bacterium]|nr:GNAT family N-acetyltransferase [Thermoanaerobaculia bacterium]